MSFGVFKNKAKNELWCQSWFCLINQKHKWRKNENGWLVIWIVKWTQSLPASESFPMSQLLAWGGQSTGASALASFLPKKSQGWSPSEWTGWTEFSNYDGKFRLPLVLTVGRPIFHSNCEGEMEVALESL